MEALDIIIKIDTEVRKVKETEAEDKESEGDEGEDQDESKDEDCSSEHAEKSSQISKVSGVVGSEIEVDEGESAVSEEEGIYEEGSEEEVPDFETDKEEDLGGPGGDICAAVVGGANNTLQPEKKHIVKESSFDSVGAIRYDSEQLSQVSSDLSIGVDVCVLPIEKNLDKIGGDGHYDNHVGNNRGNTGSAHKVLDDMSKPSSWASVLAARSALRTNLGMVVDSINMEVARAGDLEERAQVISKDNMSNNSSHSGKVVNEKGYRWAGKHLKLVNGVTKENCFVVGSLD
ncbi:hypothetical protein U1Q18_009962 [Sarracenia purpurea var. burkii]